MRLKLNKTLRAALIAAITAVGFTLPQSYAETNTARINTEDTSLISWFSFNTDSSVTAGSKTTGWNNLLTFNEGGYGTTGSGHNMNGSDSNTKGDSFTLSFDINAMEAGTLLHMRTENNSGIWRNMKLTSTAEEKLSLTFLGDNRHTDIDLSSAPEWTTVTITETGANLLVYVNGVQQGSIDMTGATNWIGKGLGFNFGSDFGGTANVQTAALKNILVYSKALTAIEVAALTSTEVFGTYTWVGDGATNEWSSSAPCWTKEGSQDHVVFSNGNDALFNSTGGANTTVNVTGNILAGTVTVDSTAYTFNIGAEGAITAGKLVITGTDAKLTINGEGRTMTIDSLTNDGELSIGTGATVSLTTAEYTVNSGQTFKTTGAGLLMLTTLKVAGGTLDIASDLKVSGGGNGKGAPNNSKGLFITGSGSTVNIDGGTTKVTGAVYMNGTGTTSLKVGTGDKDAILVARRIELGDAQSGTGAFTIGARGKVVVTGNEDIRTGGNPQKNTSLQLGEWSQSVTTSISGKLYARETSAFLSKDAADTINITGGTMAVKGIATTDANNSTAHTLTISNNGKLILGEFGLPGEAGNWNISAGNAEIGMYADTVVGRALTLDGDLTFNTAKYTWEGSEATLNLKAGEEGGTMTVSGSISGTGSLIKEGAGTLVLSGENTYTGDTVVKGGTLDIQGSIANSTVKVAENATLAGDTSNISMGIKAGKTATITDAEGFTPKDSGVTFISDSGEVKVQNTREDAEITYGIGEEAAEVIADILVVDSETNVTVKNKVVVGDIGNLGEGGLTLTHVDVESLQGVHALNGALTLQNITEVVSLDEIEIASGSKVAVYKGAVADATQEGTVTIKEKLKAGGGTLLANLEMANGSKLAVNGGGENALTLGSQFTIVEGALVRLDEATLAALDNLAVGESLTLIKALNQTTLGYGQDYADTWYDAMFSRVDGEYSLAGDFQVFANETYFGLTKVSNVPEPATGTLSLLALMALAARRRRK